MRIDELLWPRERVEHIARHGVSPEEFEQVCFSKPLVLRARSFGEKPGLLSSWPNRRGALLVCCRHPVPGRKGLPGHCQIHDRKRKTSISAMERTMKTQELPQTDSIQELAQFWDTHDLTDFEDALEEVTEPVFAPRNAIRLDLDSIEADAVRKIAEAQGIADAELIHAWVREKIGAR